MRQNLYNLVLRGSRWQHLFITIMASLVLASKRDDLAVLVEVVAHLPPVFHGQLRVVERTNAKSDLHQSVFIVKIPWRENFPPVLHLPEREDPKNRQWLFRLFGLGFFLAEDPVEPSDEVPFGFLGERGVVGHLVEDCVDVVPDVANRLREVGTGSYELVPRLL